MKEVLRRANPDAEDICSFLLQDFGCNKRVRKWKINVAKKRIKDLKEPPYPDVRLPQISLNDCKIKIFELFSSQNPFLF